MHDCAQIELFWRRAISDPEYKRIFCLVHAEKLTYQVSDQALSSLSKFSQAHQSKRIVTQGQTIVQKPGALDCIFQVCCPRLLEVSGVIKLTTTFMLVCY